MGWLQKLSGGSSRAPKPEPKCPYLYDAGEWGGARYYCENTTDKGLLGQGTRITLPPNQVSNFCKGNFNRCPLKAMTR